MGEQAEAEDKSATNAHSNTEAENLLEEEVINAKNGISGVLRTNSVLSPAESYSLVKGFQLKFSQFYAMFVKRLLNSKRKKTAVITQLLVPLIILLIGI